jgi:hypothetical protein
MNRLSSFKNRLRSAAGFALALGACALLAASVTAADPKPAKDAKPEKKAKTTKLSGADLYAMHCNRCHPERYATERTEAQWKTIMLHMRIRANIPATQAKAIMKYLQEDAGK